jgi:hypothetical protein
VLCVVVRVRMCMCICAFSTVGQCPDHLSAKKSPCSPREVQDIEVFKIKIEELTRIYEVSLYAGAIEW